MKRIISLLLCIIMMLSLFPLQAFAADSALQIQPGKNDKLTDSGIDYNAYPGIANYGLVTNGVGDRLYNETENNNTIQRAKRIYNDYTVKGTLSSRDRQDNFKFTLSTTSTVTIVAVARYRTFKMGVFKSASNCIGADTTGTRNGSTYAYGLTGTLSKGTYYLSLQDSSYNDYMFYIQITPLRAPTVRTTNRASDGKVILTWNKVASSARYYVYYSTSRSGSYKSLGYTTGNSVAVNGLTPGRTYYFKVRAYTGGSYTGYSNIVGNMADLARPNVSISLRYGDPRLSWYRISGTYRYDVYRATSASGTYRRIGYTTGTSFTDTSAVAGRTYYYIVRAVHRNSSANSAYSAIRYIRAR